MRKYMPEGYIKPIRAKSVRHAAEIYARHVYGRRGIVTNIEFEKETRDNVGNVNSMMYKIQVCRDPQARKHYPLISGHSTYIEVIS
jgi:hypothetical protein